MYGIISELFGQMIQRHYGRAAWTQICEWAEVSTENGGHFTLHQRYSDELIYRLLSKASDHLGKTSDELLELFGEEFWSYILEYKYDGMLRVLGSNLREFLTNLDALHDHLASVYPQMQAPSFRCETGAPNELLLHYYSRRQGLGSIVKGMVRKIAKELFESDISIELYTPGEDEEEENSSESSDVIDSQTGTEGEDTQGFVNVKPVTFIIHELDKNGQPIHSGPLRRVSKILANSIEDIIVPPPNQHYVSSRTLCVAFPFLVIFDRGMVIRQLGAALQRLLPAPMDELEPIYFNDLFGLVRPCLPLTFSAITMYINAVFIMRTKSNKLQNGIRLRLKGQMIFDTTSHMMIYLCSPHISTLQRLKRKGLYLSDIPIHDASRDLILHAAGNVAEMQVMQHMEELVDALRRTETRLEREMRTTDRILHSILPESAARLLREGRAVPAEKFKSVTILFSDIKGFTELCAQCHPLDVIRLLNNLYTRFDRLVQHRRVYKVETIGDAYMVVGGLPERCDDHAERIVHQALDMLGEAELVKNPVTSVPVQIRIGIHSGPVMAGIVGEQMPRYCLFGQTVNIASRAEGDSEGGKINITDSTYDLIHHLPEFAFRPRGPRSLKGVGRLVESYFITDRAPDRRKSADELEPLKTVSFFRTPTVLTPVTGSPLASPVTELATVTVDEVDDNEMGVVTSPSNTAEVLQVAATVLEESKARGQTLPDVVCRRQPPLMEDALDPLPQISGKCPFMIGRFLENIQEAKDEKEDEPRGGRTKRKTGVDSLPGSTHSSRPSSLQASPLNTRHQPGTTLQESPLNRRCEPISSLSLLSKNHQPVKARRTGSPLTSPKPAGPLKLVRTGDSTLSHMDVGLPLAESSPVINRHQQQDSPLETLLSPQQPKLTDISHSAISFPLKMPSRKVALARYVSISCENLPQRVKEKHSLQFSRQNTLPNILFPETPPSETGTRVQKRSVLSPSHSEPSLLEIDDNEFAAFSNGTITLFKHPEEKPHTLLYRLQLLQASGRNSSLPPDSKEVEQQTPKAINVNKVTESPDFPSTKSSSDEDDIGRVAARNDSSAQLDVGGFCLRRTSSAPNILFPSIILDEVDEVFPIESPTGSTEMEKDSADEVQQKQQSSLESSNSRPANTIFTLSTKPAVSALSETGHGNISSSMVEAAKSLPAQEISSAETEMMSNQGLSESTSQSTCLASSPAVLTSDRHTKMCQASLDHVSVPSVDTPAVIAEAERHEILSLANVVCESLLHSSTGQSTDSAPPRHSPPVTAKVERHKTLNSVDVVCSSSQCSSMGQSTDSAAAPSKDSPPVLANAETYKADDGRATTLQRHSQQATTKQTPSTSIVRGSASTSSELPGPQIGTASSTPATNLPDETLDLTRDSDLSVKTVTGDSGDSVEISPERAALPVTQGRGELARGETQPLNAEQSHLVGGKHSNEEECSALLETVCKCDQPPSKVESHEAHDVMRMTDSSPTAGEQVAAKLEQHQSSSPALSDQNGHGEDQSKGGKESSLVLCVSRQLASHQEKPCPLADVSTAKFQLQEGRQPAAGVCPAEGTTVLSQCPAELQTKEDCLSLTPQFAEDQQRGEPQQEQEGLKKEAPKQQLRQEQQEEKQQQMSEQPSRQPKQDVKEEQRQTEGTNGIKKAEK